MITMIMRYQLSRSVYIYNPYPKVFVKHRKHSQNGKSGPRRCLHKHNYPLNFEKIFAVELSLDMESLTSSLQTWSTPSAVPVIF